MKPKWLSIVMVLALAASMLAGLPVNKVSATSSTYSTAGTSTWTAPPGVTQVLVQVWGAGGAGGTGTSGTVAEGGGGGGAYSSGTVTVSPGTGYTVVVGAGGSGTTAGGDSYFSTATTVMAKGGGTVANNTSTGAAGGAAASGYPTSGGTRYSGGTGGTGSSSNAGAGGGSAGSGSNGGNGGTGSTVGTAGTGTPGGATGGAGRTGSSGGGTAGNAPGGGGGGAYRTMGGGTQNGGNGAVGRVIVIYYVVTFDANGGTGTMTNQGRVTATNLTTNTFTRLGYAFAGWNTAANGSGTAYADGASYPFTADVTLHAQWRGAVTYSGNGNTGGTAPTDSSSPYLAGATVTVLGNTGALTRTGYTFAGWNTAANGSGTHYNASATFTMSGDITLYAEWTINSYSVTYDGNGSTGGTAPTDPSSPYLAGATVTVLGNTGSLVKTGYTFAGWNTQADGLGTSYSPAVTFAIGAANVTLYAEWTINSYSVTYDGNGNTGGTAPTDPSSPYNYGATVTVLGNTGSLVKTGYTFAGWNTQADGLGTSYSPAVTFAIGAANVTLYAEWTINSYSVTYDGNGNTGGTAPTDPSSPYNYGATVTVLGNTGSLVRTGYTFAGWNTQADGLGTSYSPAVTFAIGAANITLYTEWTINSYSVTYDGNGSTGGTAPTDPSSPYNYGATVTVLGNTGALVKTGYTFAGWNTAADGLGTSYSPAATFAIGAANVTLYAQWTVPPAPPAVSINTSGLLWPPVPGATGYQVYESTEPYFTPSPPPVQEGSSLTYPFPPNTTNYYYVVRAFNGPIQSDNSNRVGRFTFTLVPGQ